MLTHFKLENVVIKFLSICPLVSHGLGASPQAPQDSILNTYPHPQAPQASILDTYPHLSLISSV